MNSSASMYRSPLSIFDKLDCSIFRWVASSTCVKPAFLRTCLSTDLRCAYRLWWTEMTILSWSRSKWYSPNWPIFQQNKQIWKNYKWIKKYQLNLCMSLAYWLLHPSLDATWKMMEEAMQDGQSNCVGKTKRKNQTHHHKHGSSQERVKWWNRISRRNTV